MGAKKRNLVLIILLKFGLLFHDDLVKSLEIRFSVIPAEAGIQCCRMFINDLDSGFHRSDDFLRIHLP